MLALVEKRRPLQRKSSCLDALAQPFGDGLRLVRTAVDEHDAELVAAQPGKDVAGADMAPQAAGNLAQQFVARRVRRRYR